MSPIPLPRPTASLVEGVPIADRHPGLQLDKYGDLPMNAKWRQEDQRRLLEQVVRTRGDGSQLPALLERRRTLLHSLGALRFQAVTVGPLTLHLARAAALENAGIALHPLYGFVHLPGSGLKGLARAYAETVWLSAQTDKVAAWRTLEAIFGWAPGADFIDGRPKPWRPSGVERGNGGPDSAAGQVVFHDAWPTRWPALQLDLVNNHHAAYYQAGDQHPERLPGDWEAPNMVFMLAVPHGVEFEFALHPSRSDTPPEFVELAKTCLSLALQEEGAGAKTAAGYGRFRLGAPVPPPATPARARHDAVLELVSPAFLAGPLQTEADCDLRPATLRGLLRWWWRTMHAGFVDGVQMRRLEAAVWGNTEAGGAVSTVVQPDGGLQRQSFARQRITIENRLPPAPREPSNMSQGLIYHSYGMDDRKDPATRERLPGRWFVRPGARWRVTLTARPGFFGPDGRRLTPELLLDEARCALWLLARFGGVGSKSRRGFGCFKSLDGLDLDQVRSKAGRFRTECGIVSRFEERKVRSAALEFLREAGAPIELPTSARNPWFLIDHMATVAQAWARRWAHQDAKKALGLPRQVDSRGPATFRPAPDVKNRHASTIHYHLDSAKDGSLVMRVTAFPNDALPNLAESRRVVWDLLAHLRARLPLPGGNPPAGVALQPVYPASRSVAGPAGAVSTPPPARPSTLKRYDSVRGVLQPKAKPTDKWRARVDALPYDGEVTNSVDVPADRVAGQSVDLLVDNHIEARKIVSFYWPTSDHEDRAKRAREQPPAKPPGRPRGGLPRH